jgi:hypothetical protein
MHSHLTSAAVLAGALVGVLGLTAPDAWAQSADPKVVTVTGGGPVIQVLPGPAQFADSAAPIIAKMPADKQQMMKMMAQKGPFSDQVAKVSGTFTGSFWDAGARGDSVAATASFKSQDGANWLVKVNRVEPRDESPMEPHFGGVATDITYHGASGVHVPLVPTIRSVVSSGACPKSPATASW